MRIAIIFEEDYLGAYPSFVEAIRILSENGFQVDILGTLRKSNFPKPPKFAENVRMFLSPIENEICRDYQLAENCSKDAIIERRSSVFKKLIPKNLKTIARSIVNNAKENIKNFSFQRKVLLDQLKYTFFVLNLVRKNKYDVIIGIDLGGGCASYLSSRLFNIRKYIYWGLEITEPEQGLLVQKLIKFLETKACQTADAILTTDESRAEDVCKANKVDFQNAKYFCVPHSPRGFCNKTESHFFQNLYSLKDENHVMLHSGWIHDVMCSSELAKESRNWPKDWRLVFHERMKRSIDEPYIQKVLKSGDEKTLLSLNPVDYNDIDDVVNSAKIGIVIYDYYEKYGTSWISLAKGSGKIAHYLRCGKPVICRNLPGFKEIIEKYQCGVMFDDLDEIEVGINLILDNYDFYRKNAYECYKEEYEFSKYFRTVIDFIKK